MTTKTKNILTWTLSGIAAALFVLAGLPKIMGQAAANFESWGYPGGFSYLIGLAETGGGIGLLVPKLAKWAAMGLVLVMLGALFTEATNDGLLIRPVVWMMLAGVVGWLRWND